MPTAQLNIRMDSALKREGNRVLAQRGRTPSELVRATWSFLVLNGSLPKPLEHLVRQEELDATTASEPGERARDAGAKLVASHFERMGLDLPQDGVDPEGLREQAAMERLGEWGLS